MRPPAPKVSSSGCGEKTMRRVLRESSASSVGELSARTTGERSRERIKKKTVNSTLQPGIVQKLAQHLFRREVFVGNLARGMRVSGIITVNSFQSGKRFICSGER